MADRIDESEFMAPKLFHVRVVRLGMVHIVVGLATLAVGVLDVAFSSIAFDVFPLARIGAGIWVGCVILLTGAAGVVTSRSDVRRRFTNIVFMATSALSLLLSVVLLGISVAEIALSEFTEGRMSKDKEFYNITSCLNATAILNATFNATEVPEFRCIPTISFDQKLAVAILLLIFGYVESLVAYHSLLAAVAVAEKQEANRQKQAIAMTARNPVDPPTVSVDDNTEEIISHGQNHDSSAANGNNDVTNHVVGRQEEFPDSEQFRAHLEGLEGSVPSNTAVD